MTQQAPVAEPTNAVPPPPPAPAAIVVAAAPAVPMPYDAARAAFELAQRRATVLSRSTLVPPAYQGPDGLPNCMLALNLADRIGADPFAVIQNLDIIHGKPGLRATFLIATVNACGRFTPLRPRFQGTPGTDDWGCRMVAKDRESGEECVGSLITIALAKTEQWYSRNGSKWKTMPEQMLAYRAAAFWVRLYAPELSLGIQTSDEVQDVYGGAPDPFLRQEQPAAVKALEAKLRGDPPAPVAEAEVEPAKAEPPAQAQPVAQPPAQTAAAEPPKPASQPKLVEETKLVDPPKQAPAAQAAPAPAPPADAKPAPAKAAKPKAGVARDGSDGSVPADQEPPPNAGDAWEPPDPAK